MSIPFFFSFTLGIPSETHLNDKREPHAQSYSFRHDEIIVILSLYC